MAPARPRPGTLRRNTWCCVGGREAYSSSNSASGGVGRAGKRAGGRRRPGPGGGRKARTRCRITGARAGGRARARVERLCPFHGAEPNLTIPHLDKLFRLDGCRCQCHVQCFIQLFRDGTHGTNHFCECDCDGAAADALFTSERSSGSQ